MRFALLCYATFSSDWGQEDEDAVMARHRASQNRHEAAGTLGPHLRLMPTSAAVTVRTGAQPLVLDGPFAETKEQLLGLWIVEAASLEEAIGVAKEYASHTAGGALEVRPVLEFHPGNFPV